MPTAKTRTSLASVIGKATSTTYPWRSASKMSTGWSGRPGTGGVSMKSSTCGKPLRAHPCREKTTCWGRGGRTDGGGPGRANPRNPARTARLALRCTKVRLQAPQHRIAEKLPSIEVFAIHALEIGADDGIEPLEWLLLSSVPTHTCEQALERLAWYARRWTIESW